ncbi:MAG: acylneuraminate cytidylyltransferase family protein [Gammaproteobacteria bacterium]
MAAKHILTIVPARGGSKGIPGKNIRPFAGKPLIAHSIHASLACPMVSQTVVSTDDASIADVATRYGAEVIKRPAELATDTALVIEAIRYTVRKVEERGTPVDVIMLLEPTSPVRRDEDIERCLQVVLDDTADSAATYTQSPISPNRLWRIDGDVVEPYIAGAVPWLPRQKQPVAFELTGQIYTMSKAILFADESAISTLLGRIYPVLTPRESALDIDTELDFVMAEKVFEHFHAQA